MPLDARYRWKFEVTDAYDRQRTFAIGIDGGQVIATGPAWFKTDPDTSDLIAAARQAAAEQARKQRRS